MVRVSDAEYSDEHVGEQPVQWPKEAISAREQMYGAEEIVESIRDCRGCSDAHGLCDRHRGMVEGYGKAVRDMTREFDITAADVEGDDE